MRPLIRRSVLLVGALAALWAEAAVAQLPDPYLVPRGALRVSFTPSYANFDQLFDAAGQKIPLGAYLSTDSLGTFFFPTLSPAELAVRSLSGDSTFRFDAGAFRTRLDGDIRRFPFSIALGLSSRLTFTATVPIVTTRVNSRTVLDTAGANAGWNQVTDLGAVQGARDSVTLLLNELAAAQMTLEAGIANGQFGCPSDPMCDQARALAEQIPTFVANLSALVGIPGLVTGDGATPAPPLAPLAGSAAGRAIQQAIDTVSSGLVALGLAPLTGTLPLPSGPASAAGVDTVLGNAAFGYALSPLSPVATTKLSGLGDIELGLRYGLAQRPSLRAVLGLTARLPTGKRDSVSNVLLIGTGDRQLDLIGTLDAAFEPGKVFGLWLAAAYTLQFPDQLERRVTPLDRPIAPATTEMVVQRNLGDVLRVSAHPAVRLSQQFRVFLSAFYYHKGGDRYSAGGTQLTDLEALTRMQTWGFGAGVWFRGDRGKSGASMPIDANLAYNVAYYGSGGATPKTSMVNLGLRLYYNLWGPRPAPAAPAPEPAPGG
jgi:hypothetical protein